VIPPSLEGGLPGNDGDAESSIMGRRFVITATLLLVAGVAHAGLPGAIVESARTLVDGVKDGATAVGETTRDYFLHGRDEAADTWDRDVYRVRDHVREHRDRAMAEVGMRPASEHREGAFDGRTDEPLGDASE
jgi:hypothetical protein